MENNTDNERTRKERERSPSGYSVEKELNKQWLEHIIQKRECIYFIPSHRDHNKCYCGRPVTKHDYANIVPLDANVKRSREKWNVLRHTGLSPTDAYGTINFQGGPHPNKAQYVRLSFDTSPEVVLKLFHEHWGLELPKLLISVHGGLTNFDLHPKLKRIFRKGLLKAAKTSGAWIITAGTNTGVMKQVGDVLGDWMTQAKNNIVTIGIAPWGVIHNRNDLIGRDIEAPYYSSSVAHGASIGLNCNHSYFLLVDNGTMGKYGCEIMLRKRLEKHISQQKFKTRLGMSSYGVPVVNLVLEGGISTIHSVVESVTDQPPIPIVVMDGSGRAADMLAMAHRLMRNDGTMSESVRQQLLQAIQRAFRCNIVQSEKIMMELMICMRKKSLVTVFRNNESGEHDLDMSILTALLFAQNALPSDQLSLALAWNRVDIARGQVFTANDSWKEETLDAAMMDALINDRTEFVQLLLEKGVSMQRWLTISRLEELYNADLQVTTSKTSITTYSQRTDMSTLRHLIKEEKKHIPVSYRYTLLDIGLVIDSLMGGAYRSTYSRNKFQVQYLNHMKLSQSQQQSAGFFRYPFHELMVWAVLLQRQKMAKFMWQHGEEALAKALVACKLYKSIAKEAEQDDFEVEICQKLMDYSQEFANLACELVDHCYHSDDDVTLQLLTYKLKSWSDETCLSLAHMAALKEFVAHHGCQTLLTQMWMGALRLRKYTPIRIILGLLIPPTIIWMEFKTFDELRMLPQTAEEHIHGMGSDANSDGSSIFGSDDESDDQHELDEEEQKVVNTQQPQIQVTKADGTSDSSKSLYSFHGAILPPQRRRGLTIKRKFFEFYTAPITKFWLHTLGYLAYLILLTYAVLIKWSMTPNWEECYAIAYILALLLDKIFEIVQSDPRTVSGKLRMHLFDFWNLLDLIIIGLVVVGTPLRLASTSTLLHGRVCFCLAASLSYVRLFDVFSISRFLGPYVYMMAKMLPQMAQCCMVLLIILMTFGIVRQAIVYPHNYVWTWDLLEAIFHKPYFNIYGEVYKEEIDPECGPGLEFECTPARWIFPVAFAVYMVLAAILLLSMLIAVISTTYQRLYRQTTQIWMFRRYGLVVEYETKTLLPPPFSVINRIISFVKYCIRQWRNAPTILLGTGLRLYLSDAEIEKVHDFEEECLEMYFLSVDQKIMTSGDGRIRVLSDRIEVLSNRLDDLVHRDKLRTAIIAIDKRLADIESMTSGDTGRFYGESSHPSLDPNVIGNSVLHRSLPASFFHKSNSLTPHLRHRTIADKSDLLRHTSNHQLTVGENIRTHSPRIATSGDRAKSEGLETLQRSNSNVAARSISSPKVHSDTSIIKTRSVTSPRPQELTSAPLTSSVLASNRMSAGISPPVIRVTSIEDSTRNEELSDERAIDSKSDKVQVVANDNVRVLQMTDEIPVDDGIAGGVRSSLKNGALMSQDEVFDADVKTFTECGTQTDLMMIDQYNAFSPHVYGLTRGISRLVSPRPQPAVNDVFQGISVEVSDEKIYHEQYVDDEEHVVDMDDQYSVADIGEYDDNEIDAEHIDLNDGVKRQRLFDTYDNPIRGDEIHASPRLSITDHDENTMKPLQSMERLFYSETPVLSMTGSEMWEQDVIEQDSYLNNRITDDERSRYIRRSASEEDEEMKRAEEGMNVAMEMMVRRRIRTISLTRDDSMAVIARATDAKMSDVTEEQGYHSDGDSSTLHVPLDGAIFHAYSDTDLAITTVDGSGGKVTWHLDDESVA